MRGTLSADVVVLKELGIIPADAGNTDCGTVRDLLTEDHPRGCGEHIDKVDTAHEDGGSSPRMRGTRQHVHARVSLHRIIPADAGNTGSAPCCSGRVWDHPRGCGEHPAPLTQ